MGDAHLPLAQATAAPELGVASPSRRHFAEGTYRNFARFRLHGLVLRHDYGTVPPKVDYRLTELGRSLAETMSVLDQWVVDHYYEVAGARERYLRRNRRKKVVKYL